MNWQKLFEVDWEKIFVPEISLLELIIRGTLMYFAMFVVLRVLRRGVGSIGITDLLVLVIIADAAQNGMSGDYKSVTEGVVLVMTVAGWDWVLDYLGFKSRAIEAILRPSPLALIKNGEMLRPNLEREMITEEELFSQLRQQGILDISEVKEARLEGDGKISIIKTEEKSGEKDNKTQESNTPGAD
ncbi:MAG TPA: YetF domain-containing protein [Pyrinomonadaceae bacterium]|jgi:uncharacterized membrane protein YcaP (DUF421 family)